MTTGARLYPFSDLELSRRLERAEAKANAAFVAAHARIDPGLGATSIEVAGAYAMFDGVGSPTTQTFGLGLFDPVGAAELDALEGFFESRGSAVYHEVSPLAQSDLPALLSDRGYRPIELTSILYRPLPIEAPSADAAIVVRESGAEEVALWSETAARGWGGTEEIAEFVRLMGSVGTESGGTTHFIAELEGRAIATGVLNIHDGVAQLAGASTIPDGRGRGAQLALLESRLRHAAARGCDLATMGAQPGSASQRNAERQGFRIAYTRTKWERRREKVRS